MLRLGIVGCDTSHAHAFAGRLNHVGVEPEHWVDGARVVAAYAGTSRVLGQEQIAADVDRLMETGVTMVADPGDLIGRIDAVLVLANEGAVHRELVLPLLDAGLPVYVNKPFTSSTEDARLLVDTAVRRGLPLISASALRFATEVVEGRADRPWRGVDTYTPATLHDANPGLFHYGVHGVEMLYALLGPGCHEVTCVFEAESEVVVGRWRDGRLGSVRGLRGGLTDYGFTAFGNDVVRAVRVPTGTIYRDLLRVVVPVLAGDPSPVSPEELIEVVAFQEAALASKQRGGRPAQLQI